MINPAPKKDEPIAEEFPLTALVIEVINEMNSTPYKATATTGTIT